MISFDTNCLVRLAVADDPAQTAAVTERIRAAIAAGERIILLPVVFLELCWVLEKQYAASRSDFTSFAGKLLQSQAFHVEQADVLREALARYAKGGDFADHLIVALTRAAGATSLLSFDRKLQKAYPGFVLQP